MLQPESSIAPGPAFAGVTVAQWNALAAKRVYFGHQSVGTNVMDGVQEVLGLHPSLGLRIADVDAGAWQAPGIYHGKVGYNGDPGSKTAAFGAAVRQLAPDVAILKYCYVDVGATTKPDSLFAEYRKQMIELRARHDRLCIVHVTLPLTTVGGVKEWLACRVRGTATSRDLNALRHEYNELLRQEFSGTEPVFDLARVESTHADGSRHGFVRGGSRIHALAPELTDDGGHLNAAGRRAAAEDFLAVLASLQPANGSA